jgi:hyperosmotically inducible periplasmic protein
MKTIKNILVTSALALLFAGCAGDRYHRSTGAYFDDKATTAKVKADLFSDPVVRGSEVKVKTYQGKVQLSGFVDTQQQKDRAAEIARRINGVQWVKNDLIVKTELPQNPGAPTSPAPTARGYYRGSANEPAGAEVKGSINTSTSRP